VLFKCACGKFESKAVVILTKNITEIRNDLRTIGTAFSHIETDSTFVDQQGYDVHARDEDNVTIEELITQQNGNQEMVQVKCSGGSQPIYAY